MDTEVARPLRAGRRNATLVALAQSVFVIVAQLAAPAWGGPLPTSLPTSTPYLSYENGGYTGTIPTQYG